MREIKFRAWEKSLQEIISVHDIDFSSRQINTNGAWRLFNEVELMQYTGLKDKNGKEIYEGDIVEIHHPKLRGVQDESIERGEIVFNGERGGFAWKEPRTGILYGLVTNDNANEVIGNIYENPELLEQKP